MTGEAGYPSDCSKGWGLIRLENALFFAGSARGARRVWDTRHADGLDTGDVHEHPSRRRDQHAAAPGHARLDRRARVGEQRDAGRQQPRSRGRLAGRRTDIPRQRLRQRRVDDRRRGRRPATTSRWCSSTRRRPATGRFASGAPRSTSAIPARATRSSPPGRLPAPPVSTGVQDTLVVRVRFADIAAEPSLTEPAEPRWPRSPTTSTRSATARHRSCRRIAARSISITTRTTTTTRSRNLLIELTEEVVAKLVAAEAQRARHRRAPGHRHQRRQLHGRLGDDRPMAVRPAGRLHAADLGLDPVVRQPGGAVHARHAASVRLRRSLRARRRRRSRGRTSTSGTTWPACSTTCTRSSGRRNEPAGSRRTATRSSSSRVRRRRAPTPASTRFRSFFNTSTAANRKAIAIGLTEGAAHARRREGLLLRRGAQQRRAAHYDDGAARHRRAHLLRERAGSAGRGPGHPSRQEPADDGTGRRVLRRRRRRHDSGNRDHAHGAGGHRRRAISTSRWTTRRRSPTTTCSSRAATRSTASSCRG